MSHRLLLIEDNPGDAVIFREKVGAGPLDTTLDHVVRLREGLDRLASEAYDLVFVDLSLPDAQGLEAVDRVRKAAPHLPLIVLTGLDDATAAAEAKQRGAVDYLVKWYVDSESLARYIRYAIEQYRLLGHEGATAPASRRWAAAARARAPEAVETEAGESTGDGASGPSSGSSSGPRAPAHARSRAEGAPEAPAGAPAGAPAAPRAVAAEGSAAEGSAAALIPALEAALGVAQETAARAEHLAGSLRAALDLVGAGRGPRESASLDVVPLVQLALDRLRPRALHAGIPVRFPCERKRVVVRSDRQTLSAVLDRLLALALATGSATGVSVTVGPRGTETALRAAWALRPGASLSPPEDPLLALDLDLARRLAARAGAALSLDVAGPEAEAVLRFDVAGRG